MKSKWGKKRTRTNLFLRSAKRNWFENRSCFCSTGNVLIFTSPSTLGFDFIDPGVTKALTAFVLNFLSQALTQLNQGNTVSLSSSVWPPNRECNSSRHTGALTLHQWSFGLKYLLFHPTKSKCSWPFELRILLLKIQMLIYQHWKSEKQWLPYVCPDFFPVSQMEMQMLCYVCRVSPLNSKTTYFKSVETWIPPKVLVHVVTRCTCACPFVQTGREQRLCLGYWLSEKPDKCLWEQKGSQQHAKSVICEQRTKCGTRGQERAFQWVSSTIFTFVIKERGRFNNSLR